MPRPSYVNGKYPRSIHFLLSQANSPIKKTMNGARFIYADLQDQFSNLLLLHDFLSVKPTQLSYLKATRVPGDAEPRASDKPFF